ncbi:MAG: 1-deoxy-D-xylulose-5-phosphate reductoisomerase [Actinobacteria bacterium]|nr:1-deoxy-D-xylulose-5-phosphate reductoisomerase [Actinomycetota bacterium]
MILGSTGSIGRQALEVLAAVPSCALVGLAAGASVELLLEQAALHGVTHVCLRSAKAAAEAAARAPELLVLAGEAGVQELVSRAAADAAAAGVSLTVLNGIVGAAGLRATMAALDAGATLALANKESMVAGGPFVLDAARRSGSLLLPVDSEHSALFQCLAAGGGGAGAAAPAGPAGAPAAAAQAGSSVATALEELLLTGSGGPFRGLSAADLAAVTPEQALKHPNWSMGPKITIDSATLMNKGLEVIEAHYLFGVPYERITVVISPQSTVHSMARFADGAVFAHLGVPDMRTPIGWALAYPQRPSLPMVKRLDLFATELTFHKPDSETFRCLALAEEAGRKAALVTAAAAAAGGGPRTVAAPIVLNAANEVAVQAFLDAHIGFPAIAEIVEKCLTWLADEPVESLEDVYACDEEARRFAREAANRPS